MSNTSSSLPSPTSESPSLSSTNLSTPHSEIAAQSFPSSSLDVSNCDNTLFVRTMGLLCSEELKRIVASWLACACASPSLLDEERRQAFRVPPSPPLDVVHAVCMHDVRCGGIRKLILFGENANLDLVPA